MLNATHITFRIKQYDNLYTSWFCTEWIYVEYTKEFHDPITNIKA